MKELIFLFLLGLSPATGIFFKYVERPTQIYSSYDFIIVGSGSSGSVLARRLSENPNWRILLLEVGKRPTIISDIPFLAPALQFTDYVWKYRMEKTPGACLGMEDQRCPWPRGRGLGGTSLINYMIYTRGHREDFERWRELGNPGWGYDDVLPHFLKSQDEHLDLHDEGFHRRGGPLSVEDARWRSQLAGDVIRGGQDMGEGGMHGGSALPLAPGPGSGRHVPINYMIYTRGHREDFERWRELGNPGWGYEDVLPHFLKSQDEHLNLHDEGFHRRGGPLSVEDARWRSQLAGDVIRGGQDMGYPYVDYNGHSQTGFSFVQANTRAGVRASGYRAFIAPAEHRVNLDIITEARVTRLLIHQDTMQVYGVELVKDRRYVYVNASKEVVLSAGAFNSPQVMMLSGIGPKSHLESLNIPVLVDLPVGRNMHDHITFLDLIFIHETGDTGLPTPQEYQSVRSLLEWWKYGRGPLTGLGGVEALAYFNTNTSKVNSGIPDMELIILNGRFDRNVLDILRQSLGVTKEIFNPIFEPIVGKPITIILPMHLKPHSVGYLELKSRDPYQWPRFFGNPLSDADNLDVKAFIAAIRFVQELMKTTPFKKYNTRQDTTRIHGCHTLKYDSDEYWECGVRHLSTTLHHQVGTCKMAPRDKGGVVDSELRVYGLKGLRVADTSVIPFALNAHTNAPAFMVGEKAADLIKNSWK